MDDTSALSVLSRATTYRAFRNVRVTKEKSSEIPEQLKKNIIIKTKGNLPKKVGGLPLLFCSVLLIGEV